MISLASLPSSQKREFSKEYPEEYALKVLPRALPTLGSLAQSYRVSLCLLVKTKLSGGATSW